jgi:hypothetical protein
MKNRKPAVRVHPDMLERSGGRDPVKFSRSYRPGGENPHAVFFSLGHAIVHLETAIQAVAPDSAYVVELCRILALLEAEREKFA